MQPSPETLDYVFETGAPALIEVTRGEMIESRHHITAAISDAEGQTVRAWGDIERPIYGRSALKPIQALPLILSGAAERFDLGQRELALACGSHDGEAAHISAVAAWLEKIGCTAEDLECGVHLPYDKESAHALIAKGEAPCALHNNCSGKHCGFLSVARHLGVPTAGYIDHGHPVQQQVKAALAHMTGLSLDPAPRGIDGCGIPVIGIPLVNIARAMARFADASVLELDYAAAVKQITAAMAAEPFYVGGSSQFCTALALATKGEVLAKPGAEGVYTAILPRQGLGIALKAEDGASRAAEVGLGGLLRYLEILSEDQLSLLRRFLQPSLKNRAGREVGEIQVDLSSLLQTMWVSEE